MFCCCAQHRRHQHRHGQDSTTERLFLTQPSGQLPEATSASLLNLKFEINSAAYPFDSSTSSHSSTMSDDHDTRFGSLHRRQAGDSDRSDRSDSSVSASDNETTMHHPIPVRPKLPSRTSSGPMVVPRDSSAVGPVEHNFGPDDVRSMSPRRTSEDIDRMGQEARDEMRR